MTGNSNDAARLMSAVKWAGSQAKLGALIGISQPSVCRAVRRAQQTGRVSWRILYALERLPPPAAGQDTASDHAA